MDSPRSVRVSASLGFPCLASRCSRPPQPKSARIYRQSNCWCLRPDSEPSTFPHRPESRRRDRSRRRWRLCESLASGSSCEAPWPPNPLFMHEIRVSGDDSKVTSGETVLNGTAERPLLDLDSAYILRQME